MKMIQIRNVPDRLHRILKVRAAQEGTSLSGYLLRELERLAALPTWLELRTRLAALDPVEPSEPSADIIRRMRDAK